MVDRIYPAELQLNKANSSDTEAPLVYLNVCIYIVMVQFLLRFIINGTISILISLISRSLTTSPSANLLWSIHLSVSLEYLLILATLKLS